MNEVATKIIVQLIDELQAEREINQNMRERLEKQQKAYQDMTSRKDYWFNQWTEIQAKVEEATDAIVKGSNSDGNTL